MSRLAINGGNPLRTKSFPSWPQYDGKEVEALKKVLYSGVWGTLGSEADRFCEKFAGYQNARYGVAVTNGTVSLEVILRALGIGPGDEVIVPPYTFNATASAVLFVGAAPVFADIDINTFDIDANKIEEVITPRTKAIIPVHIGGRACDMDAIKDVAQRHNLFVVEDAAHAHGSEWKGKRVGAIGNAGSFSFQASKNLTAGEGGFIMTNDYGIYEKCWSIHHCGRSRENTVWYDHPRVGTNARMTEWQAAILNVQIERLDAQIEKRMENAEYLNSRLSEFDFIKILKPDERVTRNSYHLFVFRYLSEKCKELSREKFLDALKAEGIPCSAGYVPLYKQTMLVSAEAVRLIGRRAYDTMKLENAEIAGREGVWLGQMLLLGDKKDMDDIAAAIEKIYENVNELL